MEVNMQNKIILIDPQEQNYPLLKRILNEDYVLAEITDIRKINDFLTHDSETIAAILANYPTLRSQKFTLAKMIRQNSKCDRIPLLAVCSEIPPGLGDELCKYNIAEFICAPFDPSLVKHRIQNCIRLYQYQNTMQKQHKLLKLQSDRLTKSNETIIDALGDIVEYRNVESGEHIHRVKEYTRILATEAMNCFPEFNLTPEKVSVIVTASPLHDIGKIALPDKILMKPGRLTDQEFEYIKSHTISGCEILDNMRGIWSDEYSKVCKEICHSHHERYDGSGYPDGLRGSEIPLSAQIVSIADVYDALTNERVYKDAIPKDHAFRMIINGECGVFSPKLMECLRNVRTEFENV
jgi:Response regulator containing a CheY-like receiver domain and an HD-GYP domain